MHVFAYSEAVRHLEQALRTQEVLDPDDQTKRCDLLLSRQVGAMPTRQRASDGFPSHHTDDTRIRSCCACSKRATTGDGICALGPRRR